jgi:hypothetical protein
MPVKLILILCCIVAYPLSSLYGQSQIIDDSTQQVYGPYTTQYQTYEDIKYNRENLRPVDSTITDLHRFTIQEQHDFTIQNLGNFGTATHPVVHEVGREIGATMGFGAYEPYMIDRTSVHYFDTKSPYTLLQAVLGGGGRARTTVRHARNITPYWNAGFHYDRISAEKQVASTGRGDRQTISNAYYVHMHYQSPDGKYTGLGSITRINHTVEENGGIQIPEDGVIADYFDDNADVRLSTASSNALRLGTHVYNAYRLRKEFQVYHDFEYATRKNIYFDTRPDPEFYDRILISPDSTADRARLNRMTNEFGLKGDLADMFYNFYVKFRRLKYVHQYLPGDENIGENSGGFNLRYDFDSLQYVHASGEYLLGGFYRFGGTYTMKFLTVDYWRVQQKPAIMQETYFGNHHEWYRNFNPIASDLLKASVTGNFRWISITPSVSLQNVKNRIYFDYDKTPSQAGGSARLLSPGLTLNFTFFKRLHLNSRGLYTLISGDSEASNSFRTPTWLINSSLFYGSHFFDGKIYVQAGIDLHYKSDYFAPAYDPSVQQFYLQDDFLIPAYLLTNVFLDFQIDHVSVFVKLTHANQGNLSGYFTFPHYIGQQRIIDFGIRWMFFN